MSSRSNQAKQATRAGLTTAQAVQRSGADLMQAGAANAASTTVGPGKDGARMEQLEAGQD